MEPPSAPISPIMPPATAVVSGQRIGTNWKVAPLPAPSAAKQSMKSSVVDDQGRSSHQAEKPSDGNEKNDRERSNATDAVAKPTAQHAGRGPSQRGQDGEFAGHDLGYVELRVVEGWQESGQADEAAKGDDVDQIEIPAVLFKKATEMLPRD